MPPKPIASAEPTRLEPGTLVACARRQWERALASGSLQPVASEAHALDDDGVPFSVRVTRGLDRKPQAFHASAAPARDPFVPPYDDLFVGDVSASHAVLLNKYPVVGDHLLVVTRAFLPQQSPLVPEDFAALWRCMQEIDGLGFYNAGRTAGASQPHKHLQLVPLPFGGPASQGPAPALPSEALFAARGAGFAFASAALEGLRDGTPDEAGRALHGAYRRLLGELSLDPGRGETLPYNLLLTRDRMRVIPRERHAWQGIPVNAMGFAGSLLVRSDEDLARLRAVGPRRVLAAVGRPA